MRSWKLLEIETPDGSRSPVVLASDDEARVVLIGLQPGQKLGDHQVKENALLVVVDGSARVEAAGETVDAEAGTLVAFEPDERHVDLQRRRGEAAAHPRALAGRGALPGRRLAGRDVER